MRLISAGSLVRAQSGPLHFGISIREFLTLCRNTIRQPESADGFKSTSNCCDSTLGHMKNSILPLILSVAIFLNAAATSAGQWTEVPGGASPHPSALNGIAAVSANDIWAVGSWGQNGGQGLIEHWDGMNW
jgi:hypothetical protein